MADKKSFVLRLSAEMYEALEKWAADEFRSTNGQLEYIISEALRKAGRVPKAKDKMHKPVPEKPGAKEEDVKLD